MTMARLPGMAFAALLAALLAYVAAKGIVARGISGAFPAVVGGIGALAALVNLVQSVRGTEEAAGAAPPPATAAEAREARWLAGLSIGVPLAYAVLLWLLGFWVASAAVLVALPWLLGYRRALVVALVALGTLAAIHLVFVEIFDMRLPAGLVAERLLDMD